MFGITPMLGSRRILLVSSNGATLYRFSGGNVDDPLNFTADELGIGGFSEYLQLSDPDPVYILVDVVEEDFRLDTVPHVFGRDRAAVIENKQSRLFRDSRYSQAILQGRESGGRRDDRVLFTSIMRPELVDAWMGPLNRHKIPVAGIYSLPIISAELSKLVSPGAENVLLVTLQSRGGLRQTFFDQAHLKVSRLASMPRMEPGRIATYVLQEVERVRRYLNSLRLLNREVPLNVCILVHGTLLGDLEQQAQDTATTRFNIVELESIERKLKTSGLTSGNLPYADRMFAYLLARRAPSNFYASSEDTRHFTLRRAGRAMTTLAVLALIGGVGWSVIEFARTVDRQLEIGTLAKQASFYEERYRRGKERLPKLPSDGMQIQTAVKMVSTLGEYRQTPVPVLQVLSQGLDLYPELQLESIEWEASAGDNNSKAAPGRSRPAPRRRGRRGRRTVEKKSDDYFQAAKISGRLEPFDGNYRLAIEQVNRFAAELRATEGVETVNVIKRPLEVSSRERLSGIASSTSTVGEALFEIRLVVRTHGEPS